MLAVVLASLGLAWYGLHSLRWFVGQIYPQLSPNIQFTTNMRPLKMTTHTSGESVQWEIPAAFVTQAEEQDNTHYPYFGTRTFIDMAVDIATMNPWTIERGRRPLRQAPGNGGATILLTPVGDRDDPDFNKRWDGARASWSRDTLKGWGRTGKTLFGMDEFRGPLSDGRGNHMTRLLPKDSYRGRIVFVQCDGNNDDGDMRLRGCEVYTFASQNYAVKYMVWATDLPALEEIDEKIRALLRSFVRSEPAL